MGLNPRGACDPDLNKTWPESHAEWANKFQNPNQLTFQNTLSNGRKRCRATTTRSSGGAAR
jgi:hypothetical protein